MSLYIGNSMYLVYAMLGCESGQRLNQPVPVLLYNYSVISTYFRARAKAGTRPVGLIDARSLVSFSDGDVGAVRLSINRLAQILSGRS
jgi:hypothetical protein